jgi:toxin FitB
VNGYLLDTNILSELRKQARADRKVLDWFHSVAEEELFLSVLVFGEIRKGVELVRQRDPTQARVLEEWLKRLEMTYEERLLPVTATISDRWGRLSAVRPISSIDGLIAATAMENSLTLVTRNTDDVRHTGVALLNPFS